MKDARGVERGKCKKCEICLDYTEKGGGSIRCVCGHTPAEHETLLKAADHASGARAPDEPERRVSPLPCVPTSVVTCAFTGCSRPVDFDINTGEQFACCSEHKEAPVTVKPDSIISVPSPLPPGVAKCAIAECSRPCHVDQDGHVHECCGYTHAMEHQRRLALQQLPAANMVKGVTHCLLPECSNPCWPFMNYCGRTHADRGLQMRLKAPPPPPNPSQLPAPKDSTTCIIPGCTKAKYTDQDGTVHPYCSKTHAELGKTQGVLPIAQSDDDKCDLEGCTKPKMREGTTVHDYCCKEHATQDTGRIVTCGSKVKAFLDQFPHLQVVSLVENDNAKPGGGLYERFKAKKLSLPKNQRNTCLAFHGTSEYNIQSICQNGYDCSRRGSTTGQAYGAGEYFGTTPETSMPYCQSGKKMLLNELLLGVAGTDHTQYGTIIVMKDPVHDLPRFVITFR